MEHSQDQAEIKGKFCTSMRRFLQQEIKKKIKLNMNVFFVPALQNQLNQTEAQCSNFEQELKGECGLC